MGEHELLTNVLRAIRLAAAVIAAFFMELPPMVRVLVALMALDIASGMLAAFIRRELSSDVSWRGIARKVMVLLVLGAAVLLENATTLPLGQAVAGFYVAHEALSIIENAARAGLPVPQILADALQKLKASGEGQRDGEGAPDGARDP